MLSWLNSLIGIAALFAAFALLVTSATQLVRQAARLKNRFLVERLRRLFGELEHPDRFVAALLTHPSLEGSRGAAFFAALVDSARSHDDAGVRRAIAAVLGSGPPGRRLWRHPWTKTEDLDRQTVTDIATTVYARIGPQVDFPVDRANLGGAGASAEALSRALAAGERDSGGVVPFRGKLWALASAAAPEARGKVEAVKTYVELFHDEARASASDSFTYVVRFLTVIIATAVVFFFGLDAIDIWTRIARTDPARIEALAQSVQRLRPEPAGSAATGSDEAITSVRGTMEVLAEGPVCLCFLGKPLTPLSAGGPEPGKPATPPCPAPSPQGFLLAVVALSFGAPFWFELLKWGIDLRSSFTKDSPSGR